MLVVRPRLYEPRPETLTAPLLDVLKAIDVVYVQGRADTIYAPAARPYPAQPVQHARAQRFRGNVSVTVQTG